MYVYTIGIDETWSLQLVAWSSGRSGMSRDRGWEGRRGGIIISDGTGTGWDGKARQRYRHMHRHGMLCTKLGIGLDWKGMEDERSGEEWWNGR